MNPSTGTNASLHPTRSLTLAALQQGHLTKRALYKMYEITGSCRRWSRMSKPLMSSVTEPPLHSWKGDRETPVTRPSFTTADYDSWAERAAPQHQHSGGSCGKLKHISILHTACSLFKKINKSQTLRCKYFGAHRHKHGVLWHELWVRAALWNHTNTSQIYTVILTQTNSMFSAYHCLFFPV